MAPPKPKCPNCEKAMVEGFVTQPWPFVPLQTGRWVKGRPQTPADFSVGSRSRKPLVVESWRCASCGRLEWYAN